MVVNCEQVWREISNYVDDEVDATFRSAMEEHFRGCKQCASVLAGMQNVIRLYGDERMLELPAGFSRRLEQKLAQNARAGRSGWSTWSAWLVPVAALALIAEGLELANSFALNHPLKSEHAQPGHDIPPDMPVVVTADAKIFHAAGCEFIHNKDKARTLTAKEAIREGYVPCLRCMRKYLNTAVTGHLGVDVEANASAEAEEEELQGSGH